MIWQPKRIGQTGAGRRCSIVMELCSFLKLKLNFLHVFAAAVYNMHVDKDEVPADPGLSMETCRQFDRLCGVPL